MAAAGGLRAGEGRARAVSAGWGLGMAETRERIGRAAMRREREAMAMVFGQL